MNTHLLAYLAGVIDSDGYLMIYRKLGPVRRDGQRPMYYMVKVGVNHVAPTIPELLKETFGGAVYRYTHEGRKGLPWFMWSCWSNEATEVARALRPYLVLKGEQADIAVRFNDLIHEQAERQKRAVITPEMEADRERLYHEIRHLNRPRNPKYAGHLMPLDTVEEVSA